MKVYKFFKDGEPKFHDAKFYRDRPVSDHIHEVAHRERLLRTCGEIEYLFRIDPALKSLTDLGAGNGGLLNELKGVVPKAVGYDLSPLAVEDGKKRYGVDLRLLDFVNEFEKVEVGDVICMNETLEHLVDPWAVLEKVQKTKAKWVVASVPAGENAERHYEFHLWAWEPPSFGHMFRSLGFEVLTHYVLGLVGTQYLVARCSR